MKNKCNFFIVGSSTPTPTPCLLPFFFKFFIFTTIIAAVNRFLSIEIPTLLCNIYLYYISYFAFFFYFAFFYSFRVFSSFLLFPWLHPKFPDFSLTFPDHPYSLTFPDSPWLSRLVGTLSLAWCDKVIVLYKIKSSAIGIEYNLWKERI